MNKLRNLVVVSLGSLLLVTVPPSVSAAETEQVASTLSTESVREMVSSEPRIIYDDSVEITEQKAIEIRTETDLVSLNQNQSDNETEDIIVDMSEVTSETASAEAALGVAVEELVIQEDRAAPIYTLVKDGVVLPNQHIAEQWIVHDICSTYNLPEKYVFGMIIMESGFEPTAKSSAACQGLAQISGYWLRSDVIPEFEAGRRNRNLLNPYHNALTMAEMMCWARDNYGINIYDEQGWKDLLYWWNTGKYKKNVNWKYSNKCVQYANELIIIQNLNK